MANIEAIVRGKLRARRWCLFKVDHVTAQPAQPVLCIPTAVPFIVRIRVSCKPWILRGGVMLNNTREEFAKWGREMSASKQLWL
jgi:hypothetical protein